MHGLLNLFKKMLIVLGTAIVINIFSISLASAQDAGTTTGDAGTTGTGTNTTTTGTLNTVPLGVDTCTDTQSCLNAIMQNTYATLQSVNNIPVLLQDITRTALSWYSHDDTPAILTMQGSFTTLGNILTQDTAAQNNLQMQQQITADLFGVPLADLTPSGQNGTAKILTTLPNINELVYPTIVGLTPVPKAAASPYNYLKAAGGMTITHTMPPAVTLGVSWAGDAIDQQRYIGYYYTVLAAESFSAYVLSNLYADNQNFQATGTALSPTQASLVSQASNADWLSLIASEDLGKVLRQILVFQSQSYVLLSDLVQTERQILTANVMTNSLLIAGNINNEAILLTNAKTRSRTGR